MTRLLNKPFFIRIVFLVIFIIIIALISTIVMYSISSEKIFVENQINRLEEETDMLATLIPTEWMTRDILDKFFDKVFQAESTILSSYVVVSDKLNVEIYSYVPKSENANIQFDKKAMDKFYKDYLSVYIKKVMTGQYFTIENKDNDFGSEMIIIMRPIYSDNGTIEATITICKFVDDISMELSNITKSLIISMIVVFILMLFPIYLFSKSITKPLMQIRDIAISMEKGDFTVKAEEKYPGEIGQLSIAMNHLASELSNNMDQLVRERNILKGVLNGMNEGIICLDTKGSIIVINPAVSKLFNTDMKDTLKENIIPINDVWTDFDISITENSTIEKTYFFNGINIFIVITPLLVNRIVIGAVGIFSDITKEVRLEQTRRDYVANVSHELKTPLTGVMGLIDPLRDGIVTEPAKRQRYYDLISMEVNRLNRLINDLLVLSRLQSSSDIFASEKVNLTDVIRDQADRFAFTKNSKNMVIKCDIPEEPIYVNGNMDRIDQIMTILLDNAVKFSDESSAVRISVSEDQNKYVVSVEDNGCGISKDDLPYIFDRFYKSDKSRTHSGSGLGLSIAKETLIHMNEKLWAESDGTNGSVFRFTLSKFENF
ncbi:MAG: ATP-binding protein [Clostridia bacterium]